MKTFKLQYHFFYILVTSIILTSCTEKETPKVVENGEAIISSINFDYDGSIFNTQISGNTIMLDRLLPYGAVSVLLQGISLGENCTSNLKVGNKINITNNGTSIIVTNSLSKKTTTYQVQLGTRTYSSVVEKYGLLQTSGNKIVDKNKNPVSLAGNSFYWSNNGWGGENYYKSQVVDWLALDWGTSIVRASMGVDDVGGYLQDKNGNKKFIYPLIDFNFIEVFSFFIYMQFNKDK